MRGNTQFARLLVVFFVALLTACAPAGEEPAAEDTPEVEGQAAEKESPDLDEEERRLAATKSPALATTPSGEDLEPLLSQDAGTDEASESNGNGKPVAPVTVDLGDITTPAAGEGGEPVEQPQPGSPNLAQTMSHRAAMALSERLDVDVSEINVVSVEEVQWRDSSLGCPQPGMSYLMVITPGFRVILEADGEQYEYHTDQRQNVVLCENPGKATPGTGAGIEDR